MGHLTLISEDVLTTLEHSSPDLRLTIMKFTPEPEWNDYVNGRYQETKNKDTSLLGGGKPALSLTRPGSAASWKVDEQDIATTTAGSPFSPGGTGLNAVGTVKEIASRVAESQKEFRKSVAERREVGTHYDPGAVDEGEPSSSGDQAGSSRVGVGLLVSFRLSLTPIPSRSYCSRSSSLKILGPHQMMRIPTTKTRVVGWLHRLFGLPRRRASRKIWSQKAHSPLVVALSVGEVLPLTNALSQDAFSPRRRGMDRRPLSEGFEVSTPSILSLPRVVMCCVPGCLRSHSELWIGRR